MKAIKIASLTALAAAVSAASFAADVVGDYGLVKKADLTVGGNLTTKATLNLGADDETYTIENEAGVSINVANGVFAGTVKADLGGNLEFDGVTVTDGNLSFGQIGSVVNTNQYTAKQGEHAYGVDAAIRISDLLPGLNVQIEGVNAKEEQADKVDEEADDKTLPFPNGADEEDAKEFAGAQFGLGLGYTNALTETVTAHASAQVRFENVGADAEDGVRTNDFMEHYVGAGVTADVAGATVKAGVQSKGEVADFGASVAYSIAGVSLDAAVGSSTADDAEVEYMAKLGYATTIDVVSLGASAEVDSGEDWDALVKANAGVAFPVDAFTYFAKLDVAAEIAEETTTTVGAQAGVKYVRAATYEAKFVTEDTFDNNAVVVSASYSF